MVTRAPGFHPRYRADHRPANGVELTDIDGSPIAELLGEIANAEPTESSPA